VVVNEVVAEHRRRHSPTSCRRPNPQFTQTLPDVCFTNGPHACLGAKQRILRRGHFFGERAKPMKMRAKKAPNMNTNSPNNTRALPPRAMGGRAPTKGAPRARVHAAERIWRFRVSCVCVCVCVCVIISYYISIKSSFIRSESDALKRDARCCCRCFDAPDLSSSFI